MFTKKTAVELDRATKDALAKVAAIGETSKTIQAALRSARAAQQTAEQALADARNSLARAEADEALGQPADSRAKKGLLAARDGCEIADARVRGLQDRADELARELSAKEADVQRAWTSWRAGQVAALTDELRNGAEEFAHLLNKVAAAASVLEARGLTAAVRNASFLMPGATRNMLRADWSNDADAQALHDAYVAIRGQVDPTLGEQPEAEENANV